MQPIYILVLKQLLRSGQEAEHTLDTSCIFHKGYRVEEIGAPELPKGEAANCVKVCKLILLFFLT